jgi:hypothetical protein
LTGSGSRRKGRGRPGSNYVSGRPQSPGDRPGIFHGRLCGGLSLATKKEYGMIQTVTLVIGAATPLVLAIYDIASKKYDAWKKLQKEQRDQIIALREETKHNIGVIGELEREDLKGQAIRSPAIRHLISRLRNTEAKKVNLDFKKPLDRYLKKGAKSGAKKNDPLRVFFAIRESVEKIDIIKERATLAAQPAAHATRTILSRRIPALRKRLELIAATLAMKS